MDEAERLRRGLIRRQVVRQELADNPIATLPGQQIWRKADRGWRLTDAQELLARLGRRLEPVLQKANPDWLTESADYPDMLARVLRESEPVAVSEYMIEPEETANAFCLESGRLLRGAPFANGRVVANETGECELEPWAGNEFYPWTLPYDWPGTVYEPPPRFAAFIERLPDACDRHAIYHAIGMLLSGERGLQKMVLLRGPGRTGKGVLLRLLQMLVGSGSWAAITSPATLAGRFATYPLQGRPLLTLPDLPNPPRRLSGSDTAEGWGLIKSVVGGDWVQVELKGGATTFRRLPMMIFAATNFPLSFVGVEDQASWEARIILIPFESQVPKSERRPEFERTFAAELPQIAAYCLRLYHDAKACGSLFPESARATELRQDMLQGMAAVVNQFAEGNLEFGDGYEVTREELRRALAQWLEATGEGESLPPRARNLLYRHIESRGAIPTKTGGNRAYLGVRLLSRAPGEPATEEGLPL